MITNVFGTESAFTDGRYSRWVVIFSDETGEVARLEGQVEHASQELAIADGKKYCKLILGMELGPL